MKRTIEQALKETPLFHQPALMQEISECAVLIRFNKDDVIMDTGDAITYIPIVLSGCVRIIRSDEDGNEVFLYHLYPGQTCTMALSTCQTGGQSMVKAVAEDTTELIQIPLEKLSLWNAYAEWKTFIDTNYHNRFAELMQVIDLIAFSHMDKQLYHYLEERCKAAQSKLLDITHQQIADELHTHREAISRLLKTMEQKKLVQLGRNSIELIG